MGALSVGSYVLVATMLLSFVQWLILTGGAVKIYWWRASRSSAVHESRRRA